MVDLTADVLTVRQNLFRSLRTEFQKQERRDNISQNLSKKAIEVLSRLGVKIDGMDPKKRLLKTQSETARAVNKFRLQADKNHQENLTFRYREYRTTKEYRYKHLELLRSILKTLKKESHEGGGGGLGLLGSLGLADILSKGFKGIFKKGFRAVTGILSKGFKGIFKTGFRAVTDIFKGGGKLAFASIRTVFDGLKNAARLGLTAIKSAFTHIVEFGKKIASATLDITKKLGGQLLDFMKTPAGRAMGGVAGLAGVAGSYMAAQEDKGLSTTRNKEALAGGALSGALAGAEFGSFLGPEGTVIGGAIGALGGAGVVLFKEYHKTIMKWVGKFEKWGVNAIHTIENAVSSAWTKMTKWLEGLPGRLEKSITSIWDKIKKGPQKPTHPIEGMSSRWAIPQPDAAKNKKALPLPPPIVRAPAVSTPPVPKNVPMIKPPDDSDNHVIMIPPIEKTAYEVASSSRNRFDLNTLKVKVLQVGSLSLRSFDLFKRERKPSYTTAGFVDAGDLKGPKLTYTDFNTGSELPKYDFNQNVVNRPVAPPSAYDNIPTTPDLSRLKSPEKTIDMIAWIKHLAKHSKRLADFEVAKWHAESGMRFGNVKSQTGAVGAFQFMPSTWKEYVKKYGKKLGITNADINNPFDQAEMTMMYDKETIKNLKKAKVPVNNTSIYEGYVLGNSDSGAVKFQKLLRDHPNQSAASYFPVQAKANPSLFYEHTSRGDVPLSFSQVNNRFKERISYATANQVEATARSELPDNVATNPGNYPNRKEMAETAKPQRDNKAFYNDTSFVGGRSMSPSLDALPSFISHNGIVFLNTTGLSMS